MAFVYSTVKTASLKTGDKVLLRDGSVEEVKRLNGITVTIAGLNYDNGSGVVNIDSFNLPNSRDVIGIIQKDAGPINLNDYKLEVGQYAVSANGEKVYTVTQVDLDDRDRPVKVRAITGEDRNPAWVDSDGSFRFFPLPRITQVFARKKNEGGLRSEILKDARVGTKVKLRNGETVKVELYEPSWLAVSNWRIDGVWYNVNGVSNIDSPNRENPWDVVEIVKLDISKLKVGHKDAHGRNDRSPQG